MTVNGLASYKGEADGSPQIGARVLVFGETGQLSNALGGLSLPRGWRMDRLGRGRADVTEPLQIEDAMERLSPNIIINTAAFTDVDGAESSSDQAYAANRDGAANVAGAAAARGIPIVHVSTDFVFSGANDTPYTEDDCVSPLGVYGASKEAGERAVRKIAPAHVIVRTSWLYGPHEANFVTSIAHHLAQSKTLPVVSDQIGSPTYATDLAEALIAVSERLLAPGESRFGTFHAAGGGSVSRFDFAREIQAAISKKSGPSWPGASCVISPILSADLKSPAVRPAFSALNCNKLQACYGIEIAEWRVGLNRCLEKLVEN